MTDPRQRPATEPPEAAVDAETGCSPRAVIERWLAETAAAFSIADYCSLFSQIAQAEPNPSAAAKLARAARSLVHTQPGPKPIDSPALINKIRRLIENGTPRTAAVLMVALQTKRPAEKLESVATRLANRLRKHEADQGGTN